MNTFQKWVSLIKKPQEWLWSVLRDETVNAAGRRSSASARTKIRGFFQYNIYQSNLYTFSFKHFLTTFQLNVEILWSFCGYIPHSLNMRYVIQGVCKINTHSQMVVPYKCNATLLQTLHHYKAHTLHFSVKFKTGPSILHTLLQPERQTQHISLRRQDELWQIYLKSVISVHQLALSQ